jgi:hypothetical protein
LRVICPTHFIFLSMIILEMFSESYKLCRSSLCNVSPFYAFLSPSFKYFPRNCALKYVQFIFFSENETLHYPPPPCLATSRWWSASLRFNL